MLRVMQKILMNTDNQSVLIRKHLEIVKKKKQKKLEGLFFFLSRHQPTNLRSSSA